MPAQHFDLRAEYSRVTPLPLPRRVAVTILVSALELSFKGSYSDVRRSPQKLKLFGDPI